MKLKRAVLALLSIVFLLCSICGCTDEDKHTMGEISEKLNQLCFGSNTAYEINKADVENRFNFDGNILDEYEIRLCDTEEKFLCVAVFTLKNPDDRQQVIDSLTSTLKAVANSYSVLHNSEYVKIQKKLFYEYDNVLILVVADDPGPSENYLKEIGAKPIA